MRRTLGDVAGYLKEIMVPETHEAYAVKAGYAGIATEERIRAGVVALRAFLVRLCDALIAQGDAYDKPQKVAHAYENHITLSGYYPFLHNVNTLLMSMGYRGALAHDGASLLCGGDIFDTRLSAAKSLACLRFLMDCGIRVDGIDASDNRQSLADIGAITIAYPDDPAMLVGMKALAIAGIDHRTLDCQDVFLRCDYRVLKRDEADVASIVRDTARRLPADVQAFVLRLHQRYVDQGLTCAVETKGYWIYIKYCYKRKDVWGLNASLAGGYHINVKPVKTQEYADTIKALAPALQATIAQGYGCGRKREIGRCDGGCRGLTIPLDDTALAMQEDIVTWLDQEVLHLQRK